MNEFVRLRAKIYSYLRDDSAENKNAKKVSQKENFNFKIIKVTIRNAT